MKVCPKCLEITKYNHTYDCYYCEHCNIWLESTCPDTDCEYCKQRPEKPLSAKDIK